MESAEIIAQETALMAGNAQKTLELLEGGRVEEAIKLLRESLKRYNTQCTENSIANAFQTLMNGFRLPPNQTTGLPAVPNPM